MSSKEYREFADECMHWAKTARSDREKRIFLQMAETWLNAAVLADRREQRARWGLCTFVCYDLYFKADYDISTDSLLRKLPIGRHMKLSTPCYAATLLFAI